MIDTIKQVCIMSMNFNKLLTLMIRITIIITCKFNAYNFRIISIEILKMSNISYHAYTYTSWYMRTSIHAVI